MSRRKGRNNREVPSAGSGRAFVLASALTALSGAAGLSHELLWTRRLTDLLGTSVEASARVFGCFFLGLALGSGWASTRTARMVHPWRATAVAEVALVLLSLPILLLPEWTGWIWPALGPEGLTGMAGWVVKWLVSLAVILPPATAMGAILPLLSAATLDGRRRLDRHGVWLYAADTLGGVAGLVATVLVALPALGATGSMLLAMGVNLGIAGALVRLDRGRPDVPPAGPSKPGPEGRATQRRLAAALAFSSGAGVLAVEVIGLELVMLAAPLSFYAPAAVLTAVILALGLAALVVPALRARLAPEVSRLPSLLSAGGAALTITPLLFMTSTSVVGPPAGDASLVGFFLRLIGMTSACLGPALLLIGQVFPESVAMSASGSDGGAGARRLGRLLAWNGVGGFLGAEAAYRLVLPLCGVHGGMAALGLLYLLAGLGASVLTSWRRDFRPMIRAAAMLLIGASLAFGLVRHLPHVNPHLGFTVLDERFGREGAVAVVETPTGARSILLSNQYVLGGTDARWDQERQAHLPLLLHPEPSRVAFIGLATGITPGAALDHATVESVTAVEVSPLVVRAADRWFSEWNHAVTRRGEARVLVEDGRTYLASCTGRFDVVIGDLYLPWGPGEGRLFSVEHFAAARRALRPGGLFCQWLPMYQLTPGQFDLILASFGRAFSRAHLIRNGFGARRPTLALIGFLDGDLDWDVVDRRCRESRDGSTVADPVARHADAVAMLYAGPWTRPEASGPVNTLGNLRLELDAGRVRVAENPAGKYLHGDRWLEWLEWLDGRLVVPADDGGSDVGDDPAYRRRLAMMRLGLRLSAWEQGRTRAELRTTGLPAGLADRLPGDLRADRGADWSRWPGTSPVSPRQADLNPGP